MSSVCSDCGRSFEDEGATEFAEPLCPDCFEDAMSEVRCIYPDPDCEVSEYYSDFDDEQQDFWGGGF